MASEKKIADDRLILARLSHYDLASIFFLSALFLLGAYFTKTCLADDWRMAIFWDMDAYGCVKAFVSLILSQNWFFGTHPYIESYGQIFFWFSGMALKVISLLTPIVGDLHIYMAMRWICFLFGFSTLALYFAARKAFYLPRWFPYYAILVTLTTPEFFHYLFSPKSQTLWIFFSTLSLITGKLYLDAPKRKTLLTSAISAGISASGLILGIFVVPTVILAMVLHSFSGDRKPTKSLFLHIFQFGFVAAITFLLFNPRLFENAANSIDFWTRTPSRLYASTEFWSWQWWLHFFDFGYFTVTSTLISLFYIFFKTPESLSKSYKNHAELLFIPGIFFYFCFLSLTLHRHFNHRYLLWFFPIFLVYSAKGIVFFSDMIAHSFKIEKKKRFFLILFFGVVTLFGDYNRLSQSFFKTKEIIFYKNSAYVKAGRILLENYAPESRVLFYFYSWVPSEFKSAISFYPHIPNTSEVQAMSPDLILLRDNSEVGCGSIISAINSGQIPYQLAHRISDESTPKRDFLIFEHLKFKTHLQRTIAPSN